MHDDGRSTSSSLRADTSYCVIAWLLRTCQDLLLNLRDLRRGEPHLRDRRIVRLATRRLPHDNRSRRVVRASHHLPTSCRWIGDPAFKNILLLLVEPEYETLILHDKASVVFIRSLKNHFWWTIDDIFSVFLLFFVFFLGFFLHFYQLNLSIDKISIQPNISW